MRGQAALSAGEIGRAWEAAQEVWEERAELSPPERWSGGAAGEDWGGHEPLAYIDLRRRQVVVNFALLEKLGARESLGAVLAHEVGHHVRFPHSLQLLAELEVLQSRLIPGLAQSLTNLFFDLQVNEVVGRTLGPELQRVYRAFVAGEKAKSVSPLFFFYLAIYEELWGVEPGTLVPEALIPKMEADYPGCRADARMFAQTFYALPEPRLQFVYFCGRFLRYVPAPHELSFQIPLGGDLPRPSPDDLDRALQRSGALDETLEEAKRRGWLDEGQGKKRSALDEITAVSQSKPGTVDQPFRDALVLKHYRRLVERFLVPLPEGSSAPEPLLPTTTEPWELGDAPGAIDWTASALKAGPLAPLALLKRSLEPDGPPAPNRLVIPAVELYLDTSGSMPNPREAVNGMTLAALVLATSALRRGARVRGVVYSMAADCSEWMYEEQRAQAFLLRYAGGGTLFPFPELERSLEKNKGVLRVVISDSDFFYNLKEAKAGALLLRAANASERVVLLLAGVGAAAAAQQLGAVASHPRVQVRVVLNVSDLAKTAAELAEALIPLPRSAGRRLEAGR